MSESEVFHADWCRSIFALIKEGGVWGVPRSGLLFQKQRNRLVLTAMMPHDPAMPITADQLAEQQEAEYETIRRHFEAAGVTVARECTCPSCGRKGEPVAKVQTADRITFYNCPRCDFSTWEKGDFH